MGVTVILSTKTYLKKSIFEEKVLQVCKNQKLSIRVYDEDEYIIQQNEDSGSFTIDLPNKEDFEETFDVLPGYGTISQLELDVKEDYIDTLFHPFIYELLGYFPEMLIEDRTLEEYKALQEED